MYLRDHQVLDSWMRDQRLTNRALAEHIRGNANGPGEEYVRRLRVGLDDTLRADAARRLADLFGVPLERLFTDQPTRTRHRCPTCGARAADRTPRKEPS